MDTNKALLGVLAVVTGVLVIYPKPQRQPVQYMQPSLPLQTSTAAPSIAPPVAGAAKPALVVAPAKALKSSTKRVPASSRKIPTVLPEKVRHSVGGSAKNSGRLSHRKPASVTTKSLRYGKSHRSLARAR